MKYIIIGIFMIFGWQFGLAQEEIVQDTISDEKYREDQFYIGFTYNILQNRPSGISQNNLSNGIHLGVIRDFPINKKRNKAIGIGLGYSYNSYFHNLKAIETDSGVLYEAIESDESFRRNKYRTHELELPIEFRWRTSTATSYKFWRIYGGFKVSYIFSGISKFVGDSGTIKFQNDDINRLQYGLTLSAGYNTWNFHVYYGLNTLFKEDTFTTNGEQFDMNTIKVGLMFYIL
ncbi:outer membrane protein beta-barrel domain protein [Kordia sp. SMS9]|uniref:porin family protein n=1 Tax=Kordia sp. SMS9 TaxID=2282170 RepID=UPI000E0DBEFA|nr:porin family protein [Kordia sp. SMS9]AXG69403.1 outer membrane protein beta-barrel domain protein [Kordia sp. SMS9]